MKFNEIVNIDGINTYKVDEYISGDKGITIFDIPEGIPSDMINEIVEYILLNNNIPKFDNNRNIKNEICGDYILIEYNSKNIRDKDINLMNNKINIINAIKSEEIDGDKQIAEPSGNFELNGKYYLILSPYNAFTNEMDKEKGIYKGIIVNPELYFGDTGLEIEENKGKIDNLLPPKPNTNQ